VRVAELLRRLDAALLPPVARLITRLSRPTGQTGMLTAVSLVSVTVVALTAVWVVERPRDGVPAGDVVRVGVPDGGSVPGYVAESARELDALPGDEPGAVPPYALVMFSAYLAPDRLTAVLDGAAVSEVFTKVPLPGMQTQIARIPAQRIPEDVVAGMLLFAERKEREARDYQDRAAAVTGTPEETRLRPVYETSARVALAEATAYRTHCSCVYAAVLRAAAPQLRRLAARPGVRAVDPAPEVRTLDRAVFLPPLPEPRPTTPTASPDTQGQRSEATPTVEPSPPEAEPPPSPTPLVVDPTEDPPTPAPTEPEATVSPEPG